MKEGNDIWNEFLEFSRDGELVVTNDGFTSTSLVGFDEAAKQNYLVRTAIDSLDDRITSKQLCDRVAIALMGNVAGEGKLEVQYGESPLNVAIRHGTAKEVATGGTLGTRAKFVFQFDYDPGDGFTDTSYAMFYDSETPDTLVKGTSIHRF